MSETPGGKTNLEARRGSGAVRSQLAGIHELWTAPCHLSDAAFNAIAREWTAALDHAHAEGREAGLKRAAALVCTACRYWPEPSQNGVHTKKVGGGGPAITVPCLAAAILAERPAPVEDPNG